MRNVPREIEEAKKNNCIHPVTVRDGKEENNIGDKISCLNCLTVGKGNIVCFYCMNKWNCRRTGCKGERRKQNSNEKICSCYSKQNKRRFSLMWMYVRRNYMKKVFYVIWICGNADWVDFWLTFVSFCFGKYFGFFNYWVLLNVFEFRVNFRFCFSYFALILSFASQFRFCINSDFCFSFCINFRFLLLILRPFQIFASLFASISDFASHFALISDFCFSFCINFSNSHFH